MIRFVALTAALTVTFCGLAAALPSRNPADRLANRQMDIYRYDYAKRCTKHPRPGTVKLLRWMNAHSIGASFGIMRCETWGPQSASLHAEGRALDWGLNVRVAAQRKAAYAFIALLLAADRRGIPHALARRMGIQELIYDCTIWTSPDTTDQQHSDTAAAWAFTPRKYRPCYSKDGSQKKKHRNPTIAHEDHIHIGLSRQGAAALTSFWRAKKDWPPVVTDDPHDKQEDDVDDDKDWFEDDISGGSSSPDPSGGSAGPADGE